jgi:hypothetical protein
MIALPCRLGSSAGRVPHLRRSPGFPVDLGGAGELHAAFLNESRTRSLGWSHVQEIRVGLSSVDTQPFRAGLCFADGPPGLDELPVCTFHHSELNRRPTRRSVLRWCGVSGKPPGPHASG